MKDNVSFFTKTYWDRWMSKLFSFFVSFKFHAMLLTFWRSESLMRDRFLTSGDYCKIIVTVLGLVCVREIIKIQDIGGKVKELVAKVRGVEYDG